MISQDVLTSFSNIGQLQSRSRVPAIVDPAFLRFPLILQFVQFFLILVRTFY